ncbi:chemotaxis protein CheC [Methanococcoides methylutens]|uniref:Chemotaxis protein CheC n=1 Tax=Methanococcoides methylutens TaxID=2226 RepID=A0A099T1H4_METMT|nr:MULTISPECIES: chemotaxis protein CheC [Methanococcoides]KGK97983.1 chemotaxis protein CheC [Methanococcoides methylutens]UGV39934.1 chemotaxis protein CheC [Methanococcoides orientis]
MLELECLSEMEVEVLKELGNIGTGHAATSLSKLLDKYIEITVPEVKIVSIADLRGELYEEVVAGVLIALQDLEGNNSGYLYVMVPMKSADKLVVEMYGTEDVDDEMYASAVMEAGNILASSFCDASADFLDIILLPSPPNYAVDMATAVMDGVVSQMAQKSDNLIIFETKLNSESNIEINLALLPEDDLFSNIMNILEGL